MVAGARKADGEKASWPEIIKAVGSNPFGLAALALLILLSLLTLVAGASLSGDQRFWLFMAAIVVVVAVVLVGLALSRPTSTHVDELERRLQLWFGRVAIDMYWALDGVIENEEDEETKAIAWATFLASVQREATGEDELAKRLRELLARDIQGSLEIRHRELSKLVLEKLEQSTRETAE
jgi:hypothetical protein